MNPQVSLLATTEFNWVQFRATIDSALKLRPDTIINKIPIDFSNDAKLLLNIAAYYGWSIENPLNVLRNLPTLFMEFLSYQFFIACDHETWEEFNGSSKLVTIKQNVYDGLLVIATGSLATWFETITINLNKDKPLSTNTKMIYCQCQLLLERDRGLLSLFDKYRKQIQEDGTFLLT